MSDEKSRRELQLQREKLKLPIKKQEILFYFTKDDLDLFRSPRLEHYKPRKGFGNGTEPDE